MKKVILIPVILIVFILISGCNDSFYDTKPMASETEESFYSNIDNIESAIIGCYSQLSAVRTIDLNFVIGMGTISSDDAEMGGLYPGDTPDLQNLDRFLHSADDETTIHRIWGYLYKGIYFCNMFIDRFPLLKENQDQSVKDLIDEHVAEARFLKSLYYFMLTQAYGGVVKLEKPIKLEDFSEASRSTVKEIFEMIEKDLKLAVDILPERSNSDFPGRANKGAVKALLAKVLLYESSYAENYPGDSRLGNVQQRWNECLQYAEQVIQSDQYYLPGINGEDYNTYWGEHTNAYRYIFTTEGDNCAESVFEIQFINGPNQWIETRGNTVTQATTIRRYFDYENNSTDLGWGFLCPTQDLLNEFEPGDPRILTIFAREGDSILVRIGGVDIWRPVDPSISPTHMACRKFEASPSQFWNTATTQWSNGPVNVRLIRFADVYLFAAEAAYKSGDSEKARNYVNIIRRRARLCGGPDNLIPADIEAADFDFNDIISERRRELACEGHRFWDLVRWRLAEEKLDELYLNIGYTVTFESPKFDFYPIPSTEINVINGALTQYEDW